MRVSETRRAHHLDPGRSEPPPMSPGQESQARKRADMSLVQQEISLAAFQRPFLSQFSCVAAIPHRGLQATPAAHSLRREASGRTYTECMSQETSPTETALPESLRAPLIHFIPKRHLPCQYFFPFRRQRASGGGKLYIKCWVTCCMEALVLCDHERYIPTYHSPLPGGRSGEGDRPRRRA